VRNERRTQVYTNRRFDTRAPEQGSYSRALSNLREMAHEVYTLHGIHKTVALRRVSEAG